MKFLKKLWLVPIKALDFIVSLIFELLAFIGVGIVLIFAIVAYTWPLWVGLAALKFLMG